MAVFARDHFEKLLGQARAGSRDALGRLLEPFRLYLARYRLPAALNVQMERAELVQETFQAAVRGFDQFRGASEAELFAWLRQILHHRALNHCQQQQTQKRAGRHVSLERCFADGSLRDLLIDEEATPFTSNSTREFTERMQQAFRQLKAEYQEVVTLRHGEEKSFAEIAVLWDKTPEAVTKTWKRALKAWRRAMEEAGLKDW